MGIILTPIQPDSTLSAPPLALQNSSNNSRSLDFIELTFSIKSWLCGQCGTINFLQLVTKRESVVGSIIQATGTVKLGWE